MEGLDDDDSGGGGGLIGSRSVARDNETQALVGLATTLDYLNTTRVRQEELYKH